MSASPKARLLIVESDEGLLSRMCAILHKEGYAVHSVPSGVEALDWLSSNSADLLMLDLDLEGLSAPALLEKLKDRGQEIPFAVITILEDDRTASRLMRQGALGYVMKDGSQLELLPVIVRRCLGTIERERRLSEANEEVREREMQNRRIIEAALDGFVRFDLEGHIMEVNDAFCELLGFERGELEDGASVIPQLKPLWDNVKRAAARSGSATAKRFPIRLRRKDGVLMDLDVSMRCQGHQIFTFLNDTSLQRRLEREVLAASEEERRRIGRDLHDGVGQQLTAVEFMLQRMTKQLRSRAPDLAEDSAEISKHIRQTTTMVRQLSHGLSPVSMEDDGLIDALRDLVRLANGTGTSCEFDTSGSISISDPAVATHLYRIAQEAIHNAMKHAEATKIGLCLKNGKNGLELVVEDDGRGLPLDSSKVIGIGMQVMNYRAALIGGRLEISSKPEGGVRVACSLAKNP